MCVHCARVHARFGASTALTPSHFALALALALSFDTGVALAGPSRRPAADEEDHRRGKSDHPSVVMTIVLLIAWLPRVCGLLRVS
jgi:hypothetical protein